MAERILDAARTFVGVREVRRSFPFPDEVAEEMELALSRKAPQALLRDLDRPVIKFEVSIADFERVGVPRDAGRDAYAEVKATFLEDRRVPIESLMHTSRDMLAAYREIREVLARPWAEAPKFGPQYVSAARAMLDFR
jgi:hypothetical protein